MDSLQRPGHRWKTLLDSRVLLDRWTQTDMREPDIHVWVDHDVTDEQVELCFRVDVAWALFPRAWSTWNRSRWKGDGDTTRRATLVYAYHGVGQEVFQRLMKVKDNEGALADVASAVLIPIADAECGYDFEPDNNAGKPVEPAAVKGAVPGEKATAAGFDWAAFNRTQKIGFHKWNASRPLGRLWGLGMLMVIVNTLVDIEVYKASSHFVKDNDKRGLEGQRRQFRATMDYRAQAECIAAWDIIDFLVESSFWDLVPRCFRTSALRKHLFCMCAIVLAGFKVYVVDEDREQLRGFNLLDSPDANKDAKLLRGVGLCRCSLWLQTFIANHDDLGRGEPEDATFGVETRRDLECTADQLHTNTIRVENRHQQWQRLATSLGGTHEVTVEKVIAFMQCKRAREIQHVQIDGKPVHQVLHERAKPKGRRRRKRRPAKKPKAKGKPKPKPKGKPKPKPKPKSKNEAAAAGLQVGKGINAWTIFQSDYFAQHRTSEWQPSKEAVKRAYHIVRGDVEKWRALNARALMARHRVKSLQTPVVLARTRRLRKKRQLQPQPPSQQRSPLESQLALWRPGQLQIVPSAGARNQVCQARQEAAVFSNVDAPRRMQQPML